MNLYNEIDGYAAQWLRNLEKAGHIAPGVVDERSIEDLEPEYLRRFTQVHLFAGLGGWPLALRRCGWPDSRPVWTGSCPCQPFSAAGKGGGFADERHLWPAFDWLIGQCRPDSVLGEQVEGPAGRKWLDLVATDLEGCGYTFGAVVFPAAGVGAPQIRHRTYWVADARQRSLQSDGRELGGAAREVRGEAREQRLRADLGNGEFVSRLARPDEGQRGRLSSCGGSEPDRQARGWQQGDGGASGDCEAGGVVMPNRGECRGLFARPVGIRESDRAHAGPSGQPDASTGEAGGPGPVNGFWRTPDWLYCRDERWRPVEPGTFPLASGAPARVGRLRAYGNAICVPQAEAFVACVLETIERKAQ